MEYQLPIDRESLGPVDEEQIMMGISIAYMLPGNGILYSAINAALNGKVMPLHHPKATYYAKYWPTFPSESETMISDLARAYPAFDATKAIGLTFA